MGAEEATIAGSPLDPVVRVANHDPSGTWGRTALAASLRDSARPLYWQSACAPAVKYAFASVTK